MLIVKLEKCKNLEIRQKECPFVCVCKQYTVNGVFVEFIISIGSEKITRNLKEMLHFFSNNKCGNIYANKFFELMKLARSNDVDLMDEDEYTMVGTIQYGENKIKLPIKYLASFINWLDVAQEATLMSLYDDTDIIKQYIEPTLPPNETQQQQSQAQQSQQTSIKKCLGGCNYSLKSKQDFTCKTCKIKKID